MGADAPEAELRIGDRGGAALRLRPRWDDDDQRDVFIGWSDCRWASMGSPNEDTRQGHRLYRRGLQHVLWMGEVIESTLIADLERVNSVHPAHHAGLFAGLRHFVVPLKERAAEVVARSMRVDRVDLPD